MNYWDPPWCVSPTRLSQALQSPFLEFLSACASSVCLQESISSSIFLSPGCALCTLICETHFPLLFASIASPSNLNDFSVLKDLKVKLFLLHLYYLTSLMILLWISDMTLSLLGYTFWISNIFYSIFSQTCKKDPNNNYAMNVQWKTPDHLLSIFNAIYNQL